MAGISYYLPHGAIPAVDTIIADALKVANLRQPWACRHLGAECAPLLCVQHPRVGLMCSRCLADHVDRHDRRFELTCDACGTEVESICPITNSATARRAVLRTPRGPKRLYTGVVVVIGAGLCQPCAERLIGAA
jgi:hypothetical protein